MIAIATIPASTPIARLLVPTVAATVTSITSVSGHGLRASSPGRMLCQLKVFTATITMIVRAMALQQIQPGSFTFLILREMGVALINGLVWGGIMGAITWWLYDDPQLGGVMTLAMMLNLLMAAMMGVIIPMLMVKLGRDPAVGSSVMITAITDTGGFFIFLGLATLFLM